MAAAAKTSTFEQTVTKALQELSKNNTVLSAAVTELKVSLELMSTTFETRFNELSTKIDHGVVSTRESGSVQGVPKKGKAAAPTAPTVDLPQYLSKVNFFIQHLFDEGYKNERKFDHPLFAPIRAELLKKIGEFEGTDAYKKKKTEAQRLKSVFTHVYKEKSIKDALTDTPTKDGAKSAKAYMEEAVDAWKKEQNKNSSAEKEEDKPEEEKAE